RGELLIGVELPQHGSVRRGVSAKPSIVRTCDHRARYQCDCAALGRTAPRLPGAQPWIRTLNAPGLLTSGELHGANAAGILALAIADSEINVLAIRRRAPLTAEAAALAEPVLPYEIAAVRVERMRNSGLLRGHEELLVSNRREHRRR